MSGRSHNPYKYLSSFKYASEGLWYILRHHTSFLIEVCAGTLMIAAGFYISLTRMEWVVLLVLIFLVLTAELLNTSIETTLDYMAKEHHIDVKIAKDVAAGAVLLLSIGSVIVGVLLFWPYLSML